MRPHVKKVVAAVVTASALLLQSWPARAQEAAPDNGWFNGGGAPAPQQQAAPADGSAAPSTAPGPEETDPRALSEFHTQLQPYGTWVDDPKYGTVWVPSREQVGNDFAPYVSSGHWSLGEDGDWVWVSDYPFGGVVFHYGRWVWIPESGWAWVPGYRYANAWVVWRVPTDDYAYVGWAPMPPTWGWYGGFAVGWGWYAPTPFVFCPSAYVFSYRVNTFIVHDRFRINEIARHSVRYGGYAGYRGGYAGTAHTPASPHAMPANAAALHGPSLQSAHVPASSVPSTRLANSHVAYTSAERSVSSTGYVSGGARSYSSSPSAARGTVPSNYYSSTGRGTPSTRYAPPSASHYGSYPAAGRSAPAAAPRYYSAPSSHYSAPPARSYSAPSRSYSAPSRGGGFSRGGGGFSRGGGGHGRR
ncbi:MAG TPA: DUF6600 domain-containing protein [Polyangiaceae bacterium]